MGVDQEGYFGMKLAERTVRRQRHLHEVAHAAHIDRHLIRSFFSEPSAKLANHRSPVLPLFLRPSTRSLDLSTNEKWPADFRRRSSPQSQRRVRSLRTASSISASSSLRVSVTSSSAFSPLSPVMGNSAPPPGGATTDEPGP